MIELEELGERIATARKLRGLTQTALAASAHVSRATLDALENGRASDIGYSRLKRILAPLGLELRLGPASSRRPTLDDLRSERPEHDLRHEFRQ